MKKINKKSILHERELLVDETLFSQANGYIGVRNNFCEGYGYDFDYRQTYINGFYEYHDYHYEENLSGFPQLGQTIVNVFDGQKVEFYYDNNPINMKSCHVLDNYREFDLTTGVVTRTITYQTKEKYIFHITEERLIGNEFLELFVLRTDISTENYHGNLTIKSVLSKDSKSESNSKDPRIPQRVISELQMKDPIDSEFAHILQGETIHSKNKIAVGVIHDCKMTYESTSNQIVASKTVVMDKSTHVSLTKYVVYTTDIFHSNVLKDVQKILDTVQKRDFPSLVLKQKDYLSTFWRNASITIDDNDYLETLLHYNLYQLNSSGGNSDKTNIAGKGLSGEGYEGHYFWDTEIFMLPFFILTNPQKAKSLLLYRYNTLSQAKKEAQALGYNNGAKIPWRTINGQETSPYYPAGSAQFHINSDVAYAIIKYYQATKDLDFLIDYGFELLIETARFLQEAVNFDDNQYHLNGVTGPDEYTAVVNDNYYTNSMLKFHFESLLNLYDQHKKVLHIKLSDDEYNIFKTIADKIALPFDSSKNIYLQDNDFLRKKRIDLASIPDDKFPLLLHYHPLYLYSHQVLKQADTLLALMLLEEKDKSIIKDTYEYYEPITTHDSSLSKCAHSIIAYRINKIKAADRFFMEVLETDYKNMQGNTQHGLHAANLGGSYMTFMYGVLGLQWNEEHLSLNPACSSHFSGYNVQIMYQGNIINIRVNQRIVITTKQPVKIMLFNELVTVNGTYSQTIK